MARNQLQLRFKTNPEHRDGNRICSDQLHRVLVLSYPSHRSHSTGTPAEVESCSVKIVFYYTWIYKKRGQRARERLTVFTPHLRRAINNKIVIIRYTLLISSGSVEYSDGFFCSVWLLLSWHSSVVDRIAIMSGQSNSKLVSGAGQLETDLMLILYSLAEGRSYSAEVNQVNSV